MGELAYWSGYIGCSLYAWYNGSTHEEGELPAGSLFIVIPLHMLYCIAWPIYWPYMIYFYEKEKSNKRHKQNSLELLNNNNARDVTKSDNGEDFSVSYQENQKLERQIKLNNLVENLSKNSQPTAYQCLKCFYKWNYDPVLRCAMCSELGPYKPHGDLFPHHHRPEK